MFNLCDSGQQSELLSVQYSKMNDSNMIHCSSCFSLNMTHMYCHISDYSDFAAYLVYILCTFSVLIFDIFMCAGI